MLDPQRVNEFPCPNGCEGGCVQVSHYHPAFDEKKTYFLNRLALPFMDQYVYECKTCQAKWVESD